MSETETVERDVFDRPTNVALAQKAAASLLIKEGWYMTDCPPTIKETEKDGRLFVNVFQQLLKDGEPTTPPSYIGYRFSPDYAEKDERPGVPDWWYQKYLDVKKVYRSVMGEEPPKDRDLITFLEENPIMLKVGVGKNRDTGDGENMVRAYAKVRD